MQSISYRDLQNIDPSTLRKRLTSESVLVITVNNKPFAAMINFGDEDAPDVLLLASRLRAQMAALSIRSRAHSEGLNKMPLKDINGLIQKTRAERKG